MKSSYIHFILPIVLLYVFFTYPDNALDISITPLGRFLCILFIVYYASIDVRYGILACLFVIFYYQMDCVEGMAQWTKNSVLTDIIPNKNIPKHSYKRTTCASDTPSLFYQKPSKQSILLEDDSKKIVEVNCAMKTNKLCTVNLTKQLETHEELMYPNIDKK
jgi:hypothetical protein